MPCPSTRTLPSEVDATLIPDVAAAPPPCCVAVEPEPELPDPHALRVSKAVADRASRPVIFMVSSWGVHQEVRLWTMPGFDVDAVKLLRTRPGSAPDLDQQPDHE